MAVRKSINLLYVTLAYMLFYQQVIVAVNVDNIREILKKRKLHVKILNNLAAEIDLNSQNFNNGKWKGNSLTFAGGALSGISGVAALATGGLVLPVLGSVGFAIGVAGSAWNFQGSRDQTQTQDEILERMRKICEEDDEIQEDIRHEVAKFKMLDDSERYTIGEAYLAVLKGFGGVALSVGPERAMQAVEFSLPPIKLFFNGVPGLGELLRSSAFITTAKSFSTVDLKTSYPIKASKSFTEDSFNVATLVEEKALKKWVGGWDKWVGEATVGLSVVGCIWDAYHIHDAWGKSQDESKTTVGEALRRIAWQLERVPSGVEGA